MEYFPTQNLFSHANFFAFDNDSLIQVSARLVKNASSHLICQPIRIDQDEQLPKIEEMSSSNSSIQSALYFLLLNENSLKWNQSSTDTEINDSKADTDATQAENGQTNLDSQQHLFYEESQSLYPHGTIIRIQKEFLNKIKGSNIGNEENLTVADSKQITHFFHAFSDKYLASQDIGVTKSYSQDNMEGQGDGTEASDSKVPIRLLGSIGGKEIEFHISSEDQNTQYQLNPSKTSSDPTFSSFHQQNIQQLQINLASKKNISLASFGINSLDISLPRAPELIMNYLPHMESLDLTSNLLWNWKQVLETLDNAKLSNLSTLVLTLNPLLSIEHPLSNFFYAQNSQNNVIELKSPLIKTNPSCPDSSVEFIRLPMELILESLKRSSLNSIPRALQHSTTKTNLKTLVLNKTFTDWKTCQFLTQTIPSLTELHVAFCEIDLIGTNDNIHSESTNSSLEILNLEGNLISSITYEMLHSLSTSFKNLNRINLSNNPINSIELDSKKIVWETVKSLNLSDIKLNSWSHLAIISVIFPNLTDFRWQRNPTSSSHLQISLIKSIGIPECCPSPINKISDMVSRQYVVALMGYQLETLNGSAVSDKERIESLKLFIFHFFLHLPVSTMESLVTKTISCIISKSLSNDMDSEFLFLENQLVGNSILSYIIRELVGIMVHHSDVLHAFGDTLNGLIRSYSYASLEETTALDSAPTPTKTGASLHADPNNHSKIVWTWIEDAFLRVFGSFEASLKASLIQFYSSTSPKESVPITSMPLTNFFTFGSKSLELVHGSLSNSKAVALESFVFQLDNTLQGGSSSTDNSSSSNSSSGTMNLVQVTVCDENGVFKTERKLPVGTTFGRLRTIVTPFVPKHVIPTVPHFKMFIMHLSPSGPPSLDEITSETSTIGQETNKPVITIVVRPTSS